MEVPKRPKPFSVLDKVLDWINVFSLLSVAVLMFVQVILRYVLKMPLMGIEELCYFPTVWLYLFAAVKASSERGQLVARVLEIFVIIALGRLSIRVPERNIFLNHRLFQRISIE